MAGLDLTKTPVTGNRTTKHLKRASDILEEVQVQVRSLGLPEYPKPSGEAPPLCDVDVATLGNHELASLMSKYIAYSNYLAPRVAEAAAALKISAANLKTVLAAQKVSLMKTDVPKSEISDRAKDSTEYLEHEIEHLKLWAMHEVLEAHYKAYGKQYDALSRTVELRKMEYEDANRQRGVENFKNRLGGKRPVQAPGTIRR